MKPYYEENGITIYNADCRDVLPQLGRFDLLLTDPPYGIGDKWGDGNWSGTNGSSNVWQSVPDWDESTIDDELIFSIVKAAAKAIVWGGNYYNISPSRGWLIWDKCQSFSGSEAELAWTNLDIPVRVFRMSRIDAYQNSAATRKAHPTQKPLALMKWCIGRVKDAQSILDPFLGSGTTLVACKDMGLTGVGIEREEKYCEIAANRLRQSVLNFEVSA